MILCFLFLSSQQNTGCTGQFDLVSGEVCLTKHLRSVTRDSQVSAWHSFVEHKAVQCFNNPVNPVFAMANQYLAEELYT